MRYGTGDPNAALAVSLFDQIVTQHSWSVEQGWLAISKLLMTCNVFEGGSWRELFGSPVLMERNNYKISLLGKRNQCLREADQIRSYLAKELGVAEGSVCGEIGQFFNQPGVAGLQPNNPRGHAFRSLVARFLERFGDPELDLHEEVSPHIWFPGFSFSGRSKDARLDVFVTRKQKAVAILSVRWTYRHDRVDMIDEAREYLPAARRGNPNIVYFGVTAEFGAARLRKVLYVTEPMTPRGAALTRLVHLNAYLCRELLGHNGELASLWSLSDLAKNSFHWR